MLLESSFLRSSMNTSNGRWLSSMSSAGSVNHEIHTWIFLHSSVICGSRWKISGLGTGAELCCSIRRWSSSRHCLGDGKLLKDRFISGFLLNPIARTNYTKAMGVDQNFRGEGEIKGGLFIIGSGKSGISYQSTCWGHRDLLPATGKSDFCAGVTLIHMVKETDFLSGSLFEDLTGGDLVYMFHFTC